MVGDKPEMKWKALTVVLGVFIIGLLSGVLLGRFYPTVYGSAGKYEGKYARSKSGSRYERRFVKKLSKELNLSEQQRTQITTSMTEARIELLLLRLGSYENADKTISKLEMRIKPFLEPKQIERLQELTMKFRDRRKRRKERIQSRIKSLQSGDTSR